MVADEFRVCAVCARVLDYVVDEDWWVHPISVVADHPPVPALVTEIHLKGHCDFCSAPDPAWEIPVNDFEYGTELPNGRRDGSRGNWGVCDGCKPLIEARRWGAVMQRLRTNSGPMPIEVVILTQHVWRLVEENSIGSIRLSTVPKPPQ